MLDSYSRMTMKNIYKKVNKISVKDKKVIKVKRIKRKIIQ